MPRVRRRGRVESNVREALADFFGTLPAVRTKGGRALQSKVVRASGLSAQKVSPGDVVAMVDFETGRYTVKRVNDGAEDLIALQNIGERVT